MEWKWTKGEPYERSRRPIKQELEEQELEQQEYLEKESKFSKEIEQSAYTTSLNHDENTWDILNQSIYTKGFRNSNKREELHDKIANRDLIQQIGFNPFLTNQNNYAEDISIRDQYMKPLNTSEEREE
jgi:hypothetical protein